MTQQDLDRLINLLILNIETMKRMSGQHMSREESINEIAFNRRVVKWLKQQNVTGQVSEVISEPAGSPK